MSGNINDTNTARVLTEVDKMLNEIKKNGKKDLEYYEKKYEYLWNFPTILIKVYDGNFNTKKDLDYLRHMLGKISNIQNNKTTCEKESVIVGEELAETYLYPKVGGDKGKPVSLDYAKQMIEKGKQNQSGSSIVPKDAIPLKEWLNKNK